MIKSWTGELVPVRVKMGVEIKGIMPQRCVVTDVKDGLIWFDSDTLGWPVLPSECTMISCPFAVGDEVIEPAHLSDVGINYRTKILDEHDLEYINGPVYLGEYRHANPNLRTKPEGNV